MLNKLVFDLKTQKNKQDIGVWELVMKKSKKM
jgi:hypothetical protein